MAPVDQAEPLRDLKRQSRQAAPSSASVEALRAAVRREPATLVGVLEFWLQLTPTDGDSRDD